MEEEKSKEDPAGEEAIEIKEENKVEDATENKEEEIVDKKKKEENKENSNPIKKKDNKEEVCETFEVSENKGEHEIVTCNTVPKKHADKKEINSQNTILRNILIVLGLVIIIFIVGRIFLSSVGSVEYNDLSFEVVSEGNIIFYKYTLPLYNGNSHYADYNFFLRKNPYKTGEIPFEGDLKIRSQVAINTTEFACDGDGIIAMVNMIKPFEVAGIKVFNDPNASCDDESRYMLLHIFPGEENKIVQTGETCYDMSVKDCDILAVTERMMTEMFTLLEKANDDIEKGVDVL